MFILWVDLMQVLHSSPIRSFCFLILVVRTYLLRISCGTHLDLPVWIWTTCKIEFANALWIRVETAWTLSCGVRGVLPTSDVYIYLSLCAVVELLYISSGWELMLNKNDIHDVLQRLLNIN